MLNLWTILSSDLSPWTGLALRIDGDNQNGILGLIVFSVLFSVTIFRKNLSANQNYMDPRTLEMAKSTEIRRAANEAAVHTVHRIHQATVECAHVVAHSAKAAAITQSGILHDTLYGNAWLDDDELDHTDQKKSARCLISLLANEMILLVLDYLDLETLLAVSPACRPLALLCDNNELGVGCAWQRRWLRRFGSIWTSDLISAAIERDGTRINWDPFHPNSKPPADGWRAFFFEFEDSWINWSLAMLNTKERCYVGLHGGVYNLTEFIDEHPGSPDTILDNAGCDATGHFEDIGHSSSAREIKNTLEVIAPLAPLRPLAPPQWSALGTPWAYQTPSKRMVHCKTQRLLGKDAQRRAYLQLRKQLLKMQPCCADHHSGSFHVHFDPFRRGWTGWWSCCHARRFESTLTMTRKTSRLFF